MPVLKNAKAEACAQLLAKGGISESAAYAQAFGVSKRSAQGNASAQMEKHGIRQRVAELQSQAAETLSLTREEWLESFARLARKAEMAGDFGAARSNLRELGLAMPGWYPKEKPESELNHENAIIHQLINSLIRPGAPFDRINPEQSLKLIPEIANW